MSKIIYADESYKELDYLTSRVVFCYTEFDSQASVDKAKEVVREKILLDKIRYSVKGKVHYSSFTPAQKSSACDTISKLEFRNKLFVRYHHDVGSGRNEADYKRQLLRSSLSFMLDKQVSSEDSIYIENAHGVYSESGIDGRGDLIDAEGEPAFLIPDIILGVFCDYIDRDSRGQQAETNYKLIREKIRLQIIESPSYRPRPLSRDERI